MSKKKLLNFLFYLAIKKYIVGLIIKNSSDMPTLEKEKVYLNKLNIILIQVNGNMSFISTPSGYL